MKPFLKWAGGKTQMLGEIIPRIPNHYGKYIEPFVGGGALFFSLQPEQAVIADSNPELINVYIQIANAVDDVISILKTYINTEEMFYSVRSQNYDELSPIEAAARTIYLNKTCFNGLYRVNRSGQFNTPFGHYKNPTICDEELLRSVSVLLQRTKIVCGDYLEVLKEYATPGDFVFLDPPYIPISEYPIMSVESGRQSKYRFPYGIYFGSRIKDTVKNEVGCVIGVNDSYILVAFENELKPRIVPMNEKFFENGYCALA